jgi:hypothetical protein
VTLASADSQDEEKVAREVAEKSRCGGNGVAPAASLLSVTVNPHPNETISMFDGGFVAGVWINWLVRPQLYGPIQRFHSQ